MTVEKLHDALNLLPSDLITAADKVRSAPKVKVISWQRYVAMASVLALVIGTSMMFYKEIYPDMGDAKLESVAEAPAAMAPPMENQVTADAATPEPPGDIAMPETPAEERLPELPSDVGIPEVPYGEGTGSMNSIEESLSVDHSHRFAEETTGGKTTGAYCGNMKVAINMAGKRYVISGSDAVKVTDILVNLDYDPEQACRCMTDITVDTETLTGIQVNLTEAFARCESGQAALSETQVNTIRTIVEGLKQ